VDDGDHVAVIAHGLTRTAADGFFNLERASRTRISDEVSTVLPIIYLD
jgi:hypothetical protein